MNKIAWNREFGFCTLVRNACRRCEEMVSSSDKKDSLGKNFFSELLNDLYENDHINLSYGSYDIPSEEKQDAYALAAELLSEGIYMKEMAITELKNLLKEVSAQRRNLLKEMQPKRPFPKSDTIKQYLEAYYKLLISVYEHLNEVKGNNLVQKGFLQFILNVDVCISENDSWARFYSPAVLDGVLQLYGCLKKYMITLQTAKGQQILDNYHEMIISKMLRYFRWIVTVDGKLMQAAIPAFLPDDRQDIMWQLDIPVRNLQDYNSYEGIGELRLLDKILYEMKQREDKDKDSGKQFLVAVIGDIHKEPMMYLCEILERMVAEKYGPVKFSVYTKNVQQSRQWLCEATNSRKVTCVIYRYDDILQNATKVENLVRENDLLFILDSCDMYYPIKNHKLDEPNLFWQNISEDSYSLNYKRFADKGYLVRQGNFAEIMEMYHALNHFGELGYFYKDINTTYLDKLINLGSEMVNKSIYLYISDLGAFERENLGEQQFIRIEQYHGKNMVILRLTQYKEMKLPMGKKEGDRIIVFTIWQLVKNIALWNLDHIMEYFKIESPEKVYLLQNLLIGVEYSEWPKKLEFTYQIVDKEQFPEDICEKLEDYINTVIIPLFKENDESIFYDYILKAFGSFLYSDATNVSDMLFLHLFGNNHKKLGAAVLKGENEKLNDGKLRPDRCKYSQKQYYQGAMQDYDTTSRNFPAQFLKLEQMERKDKLLREELFSNIKQACEWNEYMDTGLYQNCRNMISNHRDIY